MKDKPLSYYNAQPVLERLEKMIKEGRSRRIRDVYDELSIFDWWVETLSVSRMKQMRTFLKEAIKLGYTGYVCFKVGAKYCANGMWAFKEESTDGYSPKGDAIYRSFSPEYTYWAVKVNDKWFPEENEYNCIKTSEGLENLMGEMGLL